MKGLEFLSGKQPEKLCQSKKIQLRKVLLKAFEKTKNYITIQFPSQIILLVTF